MSEAERIEIENVMSPGRVTKVDKAKYLAMQDALLSVLPSKAPGITAAEAKKQLLPLLPKDLFPGGAKAGWWQKAAQLNLEAKGQIIRQETKPLTFHLA
ncbi:hypothetical protein M2281_005152 [Mesorhizobium soli]|jgi:hypothetical protein|uniref:DUF6958 family protein n=1 Tax=Pseudaminobacter soli (ex Li et al. 2025) TaxID=1295366 RepID=UPI00247504FF|nr:hypothetical protein [Mesorhizobium soli]MDH6234534.1 hypothetical protein [Mesorhizobium soli]